MNKIAFVLLLMLTSCFSDLDEIEYNDISYYKIKDLAKVNDNLSILNGIYEISSSVKFFGETSILKFNNNILSIFVKNKSSYMILESARNDSMIVFEGYWRSAINSNFGYIYLETSYSDYIKTKNDGNFKDIVLKGYYINNENKRIKIDFNFVDFIKDDNNYYRIGHRGGARNSDRVGHSENTIEMILFSEQLGCNSIEIDIKKTKDDSLIVYHDTEFNNRLVQQNYLIGEVEKYPFIFIRDNIRLKNGETIPTLYEVLNEVLYNTKLKLVWLDTKSLGILNNVLKLQTYFNNKAKEINRDLTICIGIPSDDVYNEFKSLENFKEIPSICELSSIKAIEIDATFWAPRWSLGLQIEEIQYVHSFNIKTLTWTLDNQEFIRKFIKQSSFDGMITNYPTILTYEYYIN